MSEYLNFYQTKDYFITENEEGSEYCLVNKYTDIVELTSPMLPQAVLNMYNFQDALDQLKDERNTNLVSADILEFPSE